MSYQGSEWTRKIRGPKRGAKSVLNLLGAIQDQRSNIARISIPESALDVGLSERQVSRNLRKLEMPWPGYPRGIIKREGGGRGRGDVVRYSFIGFEVRKGDILGPGRMTFANEKSDTSAEKGDMASVCINRVRAQEEEPKKPQEEKQNSTPHGVLSFWLKFKDQIKTELPEQDWSAWLRPLFLLKELSSKHLLLALPPNSRVMEAYKAKEPWLRQRLGSLGYCCSATKYPDEFELDKAVERNPEWAEVRDRLLRTKKEPQSERVA